MSRAIRVVFTEGGETQDFGELSQFVCQKIYKNVPK